jgi:hypothetical protein
MNDIDIVTTAEGALEIDERLAEYRVRAPAFSSTEKFRSCYGIYYINDVKIDIMGDFQYKLNSGEWSKVSSPRGDEAFRLDNMSISVYSMSRELATYRGMERASKVSAIKKKLAKDRAAGNIIPFGYVRPMALRGVGASFLQKSWKFSKVCATAACCALFLMFYSATGIDDADAGIEVAAVRRPVKRPNVTHYVDATQTKPDAKDIAEGEDLQFCGLEAE